MLNWLSIFLSGNAHHPHIAKPLKFVYQTGMKIPSSIAGLLGAEKILSAKSISGGCISECLLIETSQKRKLIVKTNQSSAPGFFAAEVHGLQLLRDAKVIKIPEVLYFADRPQSDAGFI